MPHSLDGAVDATKTGSESPLEANFSPNHAAAAFGSRNGNRTIIKGGTGNRTSRNSKILDGEDNYVNNRPRKRRHPRLLGNHDLYPETDVRDYKLSRDAYVTDVELPAWKKHPQVFDSDWEMGVISEEKLSPAEHRVLTTIPVASTFFVTPLSSVKSLEDDRSVGESEAPSPPLPPKRLQSLAVGSTGMFIHLINLNQLPAIMRENSSASSIASELKRAMPDMNPNLIQAIGESSLPPTFKSLQRSSAVERFDTGVLGMAFGLGTGASGIAQSCPFSIRLKEPAMVVAESEKEKEKEKQWDISQLIANMTSTGKAHVLGDEDKTKDSSAAVIAARSNSAYATTVSSYLPCRRVKPRSSVWV